MATERRGPRHAAKVDAERAKKRAAWRVKVPARRTAPQMKKLVTTKTHDTATSRSPCSVCGQLLHFTIETFTGRLLRLNPDGSRHKHQEG